MAKSKVVFGDLIVCVYVCTCVHALEFFLFFTPPVDTFIPYPFLNLWVSGGKESAAVGALPQLSHVPLKTLLPPLWCSVVLVSES